MTSQRLVEREKQALAQLLALTRQRIADVERTGSDYRAAQRAAAADYERALATNAETFRQQKGAAEQELHSRRQSLTASWEFQSRTVENESQAAIQLAINEINRAERRAHKAVDEARWLARTVFEAARKQQSERIAEVQQQLRSRLRTARSIKDEASAWAANLGYQALVERLDAAAPPAVSSGNAIEGLSQALETAKGELFKLRALRIPPFAQGAGVLWIFVVLGLLLFIGTFIGTAGQLVPTILVSTFLSAAGGLGLTYWLRKLGRQQTAAVLEPLVNAVNQADLLCRRCLDEAVAAYKAKRNEIRRQRDADFQRAADEQNPVLAAARRRREVELPGLTATTNQRLAVLRKKFDADVAQAIETSQRALTVAHERYERGLAEVNEHNQLAQTALQTAHEEAKLAGTRRWQTGLSAVQDELAALVAGLDVNCPPWETILAGDWQPPQRVPSAIRIGQLRVDLRPPADPEIVRPPDAELQDMVFSLPALLDFPGGSSLYIKTQGAGRERAVHLLQLAMLRMLTAVPPSKLRLVIVDPVGLGQNFASFMHLADFDEALVSHRIWTEPTQIEQRLADLTEHIETVIQKYLRNEFATIDQYNEVAGEVAEAFRVLVVANFPAGFTEASARRLLSIAASGPRCGVQLLMSVDTKLPPIPGINLADFQKHAAVFTASGDQLTWQDPTFKEWQFTVDEPPLGLAKEILQKVGSAAQTAKRVEVPFEAIAPTDDAYWKGDSRRGIDVPLGRAGATRLQHLRLGQGTSQHVLIAGKTGSGKSTLLHALITNAALRYSPEELELYLIDFKKGVEFKTYVTHQLPHARVIAIESEREFGLSVMQRLDAEMKIRGDRFRAAGVQDIAGYRDSGHALPRILFIVDEFQEFFVEDDKLAQEASLLLDRLVRQGRAFGIHIHLGSQTLGGAYTLARTTLGQMAVRIALQCSETDAHLILSEDNTAARLLSRPGEAIYNDANGLVEGNHPFQVVWLPDDRREVFLDEISRLSRQRPAGAARPQVVFEGTEPAAIEQSETLRNLLTGPAAPPTTVPRVWLGEPLAIQEATSTTLQKRGAANLLWLGQNDEAAAGMVVASLLSLAAQLPDPGDGAQFVILNGAPLEKPYAALFRKLARAVGPRIRLAAQDEVAAVLAESAADVDRRQTSPGDDAPRFLVVFDLPRLRELRRQEEDFSFSRSAATTARPDQHFSTVLREGPGVGVHTLVWCDTFTNFQRMLERSALKEFETRVLLQMSATDSSLLMDSPSASMLGRQRALLHREDEGHLEKFRPFAMPNDEWLEWACEQIRQRAAQLPVTDAPAAGG